MNIEQSNETALPLVSVLMTAYNRSKYIGEAIESVLSSTYQKFELIIVDDGSTDDTVDIAEQYAAKDARVRVFKNENNLGDYPNRNKAATYARGKYIKYLDSDDFIYPHGLQVMVTCMERFPQAGFGLIQNGFESKPHPLQFEPRQTYFHNFLVSDLLGRAPGSGIILRQSFEECGGFSGMRQMGDYEFWLKIAQYMPMVTIPRDLVWDRIHGEQEKFYDDTLDKEAMWTNVALTALKDQQCPLNQDERNRAISTIYAGQRKSFWKYIIRHGKLITAVQYKKKINLSWLTLLGLRHRVKPI